MKLILILSSTNKNNYIFWNLYEKENKGKVNKSVFKIPIHLVINCKNNPFYYAIGKRMKNIFHTI